MKRCLSDREQYSFTMDVRNISAASLIASLIIGLALFAYTEPGPVWLITLAAFVVSAFVVARAQGNLEATRERMFRKAGWDDEKEDVYWLLK